MLVPLGPAEMVVVIAELPEPTVTDCCDKVVLISKPKVPLKLNPVPLNGLGPTRVNYNSPARPSVLIISTPLAVMVNKLEPPTSALKLALAATTKPETVLTER